MNNGNFVKPCFVTGLKHNTPLVLRETFAPIMLAFFIKLQKSKVEYKFKFDRYVLKVNSLEEAIEINNEADAGLSAALFTQNMRNVFQWMGLATLRRHQIT